MLEPASRQLFPLEDGITYLNNGGYGLLPRPVAAAQAEIKRRIDAAPGPFFLHEYPTAWQGMLTAVEQRFGLEAGSVALTANATDGMNAVLHNIPFVAGDEILVTSINYGGIAEAVHDLAQKKDLRIVEAAVKFPDPNTEQIVGAVKRAITPRTRLALFDHVASSTALVMPIAKMAEVCRAHEIAVAVDGAHAPGNVQLDIEALGVDWYTGNFHKWYFAPRASAFLWAAAARRPGLTPSVRSWNARDPFPQSFAWTGSHDTSTWMALTASFAFMDAYGEDLIRTHNQQLAEKAAHLLGETWRTKTSIPKGMTSSMTLVALPADLPYPVSKEGRAALQKTLWEGFKIDACIPSHSANDENWVRLSAQIYNDLEDYAKLGRAIDQLR